MFQCEGLMISFVSTWARLHEKRALSSDEEDVLMKRVKLHTKKLVFLASTKTYH